MKNHVVSRLALLSASALFIAACSTSEGPASRIAAPDAPSLDFGVSEAGVVNVCLDANSAPGTYTFTMTNVVSNTGDVIASSPQQITLGVGPQCFDPITRDVNSSNPNGVSSATITASTSASGTFSFTCSDDIGNGDPFCSATSGTNPVTMSANSFHGSTTTFLFTATPVPSTAVFVIGDVEPHGIGATVNFWGAQWWKNNFMSGFVATGVASFKGFATTDNLTCGGTWISRVGNSPPPPATLPTNVTIIVTSTVGKSGPDITGNIVQIVNVTQDGGYGPAPGKTGNGVVTSVVCPVT
ncbi:MAG TPA: hypothetical protein VHM24_13095 [Gemmatimonadaceae bacterium]|nr:hypothetical protein [Gemmatimonadaceae bacterium]